jgi:MFS family permease
LQSNNRSWRWPFGFVSIFSGILVPFIILFVPEHAFNREAAFEREGRQRSQTYASDETIQKTQTPPIVEKDEWCAAYQTHGWGPFLPQLRLFTGRKSKENPFKILLRPFPLFLHPAVLWGSFTQGTLIVFLIAISTVIAEIFGGAPNFFSNSKVGYFYIGPFVGGIIGFVAGIPHSLALFFNRQLAYYPIGYVES